MANFLITGGAGFIGSHLAERLVSLGQRVIVIDDLSSGQVHNLAQIRGNALLEFVPESVTNRSVLLELVDTADIIIHLAATVGVFNIIENPVTTIENNIGGTEAVLKAAAKKRKKVLVASTSEVYGKSNAAAFREDGDLAFGPSAKTRWSYAASKLVDEFLALAYWREHGVPTVVMRFFNTVGPRQIGRYGMVVPRFMAQALSGRPLTVYGTGKQSRCFTAINDVVEWVLRLASLDAAVGQVFNLGNPEEVTITNLAKKVISLTGSSSRIEYIPYEQAYEAGFEDMERRVPDISKVVAATAYHPRHGLSQILEQVRDWFIEERVLEQAVAFHHAGA